MSWRVGRWKRPLEQVEHWGVGWLVVQSLRVQHAVLVASSSLCVSEIVIEDLGEASWMGDAAEGAALLRGVPGPEEAVSVMGMESSVRW